MKATLCSLCLVAAALVNSFAQTKSTQLDSLFSYYNENGMFNGVVLAAENGEAIYEKAFGFADFEKKIPLEVSSIFAIGSATKPFTALAIMMLKERALLSYEDKLSKYFQEFPQYADSITIRHLLTHTSGLPDYLNHLGLLNKLPEVTTQIALDSLAEQRSLRFVPGSKYGYSNSNYLLLALIIEKISGMKYGEYLKQNIFAPVGMKHSYVYDESSGSIPGRVNAYEDCLWDKVDRDIKQKSAGCGNIYSTAHDLLLFDQALYTEAVIKQKTLQVAYDTTGLVDKRKYAYGFGWKISTETEDHIVFHNGAIGGFRCQFWRDLDERSTLIVLANTDWLSMAPDILSGAENIMQGKPIELGRVDYTAPFYQNWYFQGFQAAMRKMREAYMKASDRYEFPPWHLHGLGYYFFYKNKGRFLEAIEVLKFSAELYPEDFHLWEALGEIYMASGDNDRARECYEKVLGLNPESVEAQEALSKLGGVGK